MAEDNFRAHYNMKGKTVHVNFSMPQEEATEDAKMEVARKIITEKHPDFEGKLIIITKLTVS